jgi:hypothetical protein
MSNRQYKLVSFDLNDMTEVNEAIASGWSVISIKMINAIKGQETYLCKLERSIDDSLTNSNLKINDLLKLVSAGKSKFRKVLEEA